MAKLDYYVHHEAHHAALDQWGKWPVDGPYSSPGEARKRAKELRDKRDSDFPGKLGVSVYSQLKKNEKPIRVGDLEDVESGRVDPDKVRREKPLDYFVHHKTNDGKRSGVDGPFQTPDEAHRKAQKLSDTRRKSDFPGELGVSAYKRVGKKHVFSHEVNE